MPSLVPARLAFRDEVPYSEAFDDIFHSADGGLAQACHVFLGGNGLPSRWAGRSRFVVFETGFGFGLNFLATWRAWRDDPRRCGKLHYVAVEKHPFRTEDLRTLHARYPELAKEAAELHAAWPVLVPGGHRVELASGRVVLTLFFADVAVTRELRLEADAFYLDGFAPAKNPDMWSPRLFRALSRLAAPGATAATWSVATPVREALERVGFRTGKRPGFGAKREMLAAAFGTRESPSKEPGSKRATIVGAGLAGAALCERLCARGWDITLVERHAQPAHEGSGNHAGAFHPIVTPDDSVFARITRSAFLASLDTLRRLEGVRWDPCGVLQLSRNDKEAASHAAAIAALAPPEDYARLVSREEATAHAGVPVGGGGLWFPQAGWIQPRSLVNALLEACGERLRRRFSTEWHPSGEESAGLTILATAGDPDHAVPHARLRRVRGQLTYLRADDLQPPRVVVLRGGMVLPAVEGICVAGASFDIDDDDPAPRASSDAGNLERLARILPDFSNDEPRDMTSRVAFRAVARDRLPLAGRVAEDTWCVLALGSRGLIWAPLAAELVASQLEGEPLPLEGKLVDAINPLRFARRAAGR